MDRNFVFGCATLALAAGYYLLAARIPESQLADAIGPQGLPKTYAVLLAGLSLIVIVRSLTKRHVASTRSADSEGAGAQRQALWRVTGMLAIGVLYMLVVPWLGYILSLAGLIFATTYYQGGAVNRQVAVVAVSGAVFFWFLFVLLLRIPQPAGLWPSLL
jgi:putative tricarboxylic transport membrane protein